MEDIPKGTKDKCLCAFWNIKALSRKEGNAMRAKQLKQQLFLAIAAVLSTAIALSSATYAWFVSNTTVTATGASVEASTVYSLLISNDGVDFQTAVPLDTTQKELVPVSTVGSWETSARSAISATDQTATEKFDLLFVKSNQWENNYVKNYIEVGKNSVVSGNKVYYFTDTIWLKAAQSENVYLEKGGTGVAWALFDTEHDAPYATTTKFSFVDFLKTGAADVVKTTAASPNALTYNANVDKARAMLKTLRVGLVLTHDVNGEETRDSVNIYQLVSTPINSANSAITTSGEGGADGITRAAGVTITGSSYITGAESDSGYSGATLAGNVSNYVAGSGIPLLEDCAIQGSETGLVSAGSVRPLISDTIANKPYKVDVYIWMEGCDVDTVSANIDSFNLGIFTGLQLGFCLGTAN